MVLASGAAQGRGARRARPERARQAAGPALKSKPVLDLGEFRPSRVGAGRLARMLS
jgi:hypothetical protein